MEKTLLTEFECIDSMPCNIEVYVEVLTQNKSIRLKSRLIGVDRKKYIILEFCQDNNWKVAKRYIYENGSIIVRMLNSFDPNAHVVAFRSSISKLMMPLYNWMVIYYPKKLEKTVLRQSSRLPVNLPSLLCQYDVSEWRTPSSLCSTTP